MKGAIYILIGMISACATVKTPSGGEKDAIPPQIIDMSPSNYSTNFKGSRILLEFDEYVKLKDINNQLLVSPPLEKQPEFMVRGKQVIIDLQEELRDSTTYTFNLGEGIVDNNEGNVLDSNTVVFSTGPFLDSLNLKGIVFGSWNQKPQAVSIMLYEIIEDSIIMKEKPTYFTKSNEQGSFNFSNLRAGAFTLIAVKDDNKNYLWEPTEQIGFLDSIVYVYPGDSSLYKIWIFKDPPKKQFVKGYSANKNGKAEIKLNKPADSLQISTIGFTYENSYEVYNDVRDSLVLWYSNIQPEQECFLILTDGDWTDTLAVYNFEVPESPENKPELISSRDIQLKNQPLVIMFNSPIADINEDQIFISNRIDTTSIMVEQTGPLTIQASYNWKEGTAHQVIMYPGFITDIYGATNDTILDLRNVKMPNYFSELTLSVIVPRQGNYILNLESEEGKIERSISGNTDFNVEWKEIPAGKYNLRLIEDENENGKWDTGDYFGKIQPEKVYVMYDLQKLRSNWVLEQTWEVVD